MYAMVCSIVNASELRDFRNSHIRAGTHEHDDIPSVIRGDNFTIPNLEKYFANEEHDSQMEHHRQMQELDIDKVIAIGKDAWEFIKDNKPVVNAQTDYAGAVPEGVEDWRQLSGWKSAAKGPVVFSWINGFNMETVHVSFKWDMSYGGQHQGRGKYVTQAGPAVGTIDVAWGYTVDVSARVFAPLNTGTVADPIAQIDIELKCRMSTVLKDLTQTCRARFTGAGDITYVNCNT